MKTILMTILMAFSVSAFAVDVNLYLSVQQDLAADNFDAAKKGMRQLCMKDQKEINALYKDCVRNFKSIKEMRESFKLLSKVYIEKAKRDGDVVVATCPMANADWLQKKGELRNPYYGSEMLTCGEFK